MSLNWVRRCCLVAVLGILLSACVSTPYGNKAYQVISDEELVAELKSIYQQLGLTMDSIKRLRELMPSPNLVLTANSFTIFSATAVTTGDLTQISGSATTTTTWRAYDANALQRQMNQLARTIQAERLQELIARRIRAEKEVDSRIAKRQEEARRKILNFFLDHPDLRGETGLLQAVYPWISAPDLDSILTALAQEVEPIVVAKRSGDLTGRWYGRLDYRISASERKGEPLQSRARGSLARTEAGIWVTLDDPGAAMASVYGALGANGGFTGTAVWHPSRGVRSELAAEGSLDPSGVKVRIHGALADGLNTMEAFLDLHR